MAGGREVVSSAKKSSSVRAKKQRREPLNLMDDNRPLGVLESSSSMASTVGQTNSLNNGSLHERNSQVDRMSRTDLVDGARRQQKHDVVYDDIGEVPSAGSDLISCGYAGLIAD